MHTTTTRDGRKTRHQTPERGRAKEEQAPEEEEEGSKMGRLSV